MKSEMEPRVRQMSASVDVNRPRRANSVAFAQVLVFAVLAASVGSGSATAAQSQYENEATYVQGAFVGDDGPGPSGMFPLSNEPSRPIGCHDSLCHGHGKCLDGACECLPHWSGTYCESFIVQDESQGCLDETCGGHGRCDVGLCRCDMGWSGVTCNVEAVCASWCNSPGGTCESGVCTCNPGWGGADCSERICENQCWGHGVCVTGHCVCVDGWDSDDCSVRAKKSAFRKSPWEVQGLKIQSQPSSWGIGVFPFNSQPGPSPGPLEFLPGSIFGFNAPPPAPTAPAPSPNPGFEAFVEAQIPSHAQSRPDLVLLEEGSSRQQQHPFVLTNAMLTGGMEKQRPIAKPVLRKVNRQQAPRSHLAGSSVVGASAWNGNSAMHQVQSALSAASRAIAAAGALERASTAGASAARILARGAPKLKADVFGAPPPAEPATPKPPAMVAAVPTVAPGQCIEDCSGHGICFGSTCNCANGWTGEACDIEPCPNGCNMRGACLQGSCVCNAAFYGMSCEYSRCLNDCHGHGYCVEGKCACTAGFIGETCSERMKVKVVEPKALPTAQKPLGLSSALAGFIGEMPKVCVENCNGNGKCNLGTCDCFPGYTGVGCQDFCPNLCSGQGKCTNGRCLCLAGFIGVDCAIKACCNGHGDCSLPGTCICNPGWMGEQCGVAMQCPDPTCSGHGTCTNGNCACTAGFSGIVCNGAPSECGQCPPGGECDRDTGTCLCGGAPCPGQKPAMTKGGPGGKKGGPAGGGRGAGSAGGGVPGMAGMPGFGMKFGGDGDDADADAADVDDRPDYVVPTAKKKTGGSKVIKAVTNTINLHPSCNPPFGKWNATMESCDCVGKWFGENCENKHCYDWDPDSATPIDCGGHGMCVKGECFCAAGWGIKPGAGAMALANVCADPVCPVDCGAHGMCKDNMCVCQDGWQGPACREPSCAGGCSGHGTCTFLSANSPAECVCEYGFKAPNCMGVALYQKLRPCPNGCSGNGLCMDGRCVCEEGSTGLDCSGVICPPGTSGPSCQYKACPRDCGGYGVCFNGECACDNNHLGPDCSIPKKCYGACHDVCMLDLIGAPCEFCKGQCLTLASNPVVGHHNPMLARLMTLQTGSKNSTAQTQQQMKAPSRLRKRHHREVSAVQTGNHAPRKRHHHAEVSAVKVGHYTPVAYTPLAV